MFTLAHLSDPHLPIGAHVPFSDLLSKRLVGYINWLRNRRYRHDPVTLKRIVSNLRATATDHVVVTGDFVNIALPAEFEKAGAWLASLGSPYDITTIPGNHDAYVRGGLEMTQAMCGETMRGDDGSAVFPFVKRRGNVAIVALNTGLPTAWFLATGKLGAKQITALAGALADLKRENLFRVVLIHHSPVTAPALHKRMTDAGDFLRVIAAHGAELVLHGHNHRHELDWIPGPSGRVPVVGVPSASGAYGIAKHAGAYNLYRIDGSPGVWRCEMESRGIDADGKVGTIKKTMLMA